MRANYAKVHYPADVSRTKIFLLTTFGLWIPMVIGMIAGCLIASTMAVNPTWASTYTDNGIGALMLEILYPLKFAKFLLVILSLGGGE